MKATHQERMILRFEYEQETKEMFNPPKPLEWLEDRYIALRKHDIGSRIIDWKKIRNNFFNECTTETPREESGKKVNMAPHDLFEWFKREIAEYVG